MLGNLILETTNAPGTAADCNLLGATSGRLPFSFWFTSGAQCFYCMSDGAQMEWGIGTFTAGSPNKLNRTTVLKNSAGSTARLNFLGTTNIYNETPAERELWVDNSGNVSVPGRITAQSLMVSNTGGGGVIALQDTAAAANTKFWDILPTGANLSFRLINDVYNAATNWLTVTRSALVTTNITLAASAITLNAPTTVNGAFAINGAFTFSTNVTTGNAITAGYLSSTLDANVARNLGVGGDVTSGTMHCTTLNVSGSMGVVSNIGAAYINSSGNVESSYLYSRGSGRVDADWQANNINVLNQLAVSGQSYLNGIVNLGGRIRIGIGDNGFQANTHGYYVTVNGSTDFNNAANIIVSGGGRGGYGWEYYWGGTRVAEMDTGGTFSLRGHVVTGNTGYFGALRSSSGLFEVGPGYYLQRGGDGHWRFVEGGTENFRVGTDGNIFPRAGLICQNIVAYGAVSAGALLAVDGNMVLNTGGIGRIVQFGPGAYWEWGGDYALQYYRGDRGPHFCMRQDGWIENRLVGGLGQENWYRISDIRTKENVVKATAGLAEILELKPIRYTRIKRARGDETDDHRIPQVGFSAQQIRPFIPEAVRAFPDADKPDDPEPLLAVADGPIVAALVNAFRELHDMLNETREQLGVATRRIVQLESRTAALPAT
jgi:hypothetical protein